MYPRTEYEMTEADLKELLDSMKPVPCMMIGGSVGPSQQDNANAAWARLGAKMGFDPMTVRPNGKGDRFFSAVPSETPEQRKARLAEEEEKAKQARIQQLRTEITAKEKELASLETSNT